MRNKSLDASGPGEELEIMVDGAPVSPPLEFRSLPAIRCYLDALALSKQRVLCSLSIDDEPVNLALPLVIGRAFCRVSAETVPL
jgi:hypothetical protein